VATGDWQFILEELEKNLKNIPVHCTQHIKDTIHRCLVLALPTAR